LSDSLRQLRNGVAAEYELLECKIVLVPAKVKALQDFGCQVDWYALNAHLDSVGVKLTLLIKDVGEICCSMSFGESIVKEAPSVGGGVCHWVNLIGKSFDDTSYVIF